MTTLMESLPPVAEIVGWTLLHSLWQGTLIALLVELVRRQLPARASKIRYRLAFGGLNLLLLSAVATFLYLRMDANGPTMTELPYPSASQPWPLDSPDELQDLRAGYELEDWVPYLTVLWLTGYLFLLIRFLAGQVGLWSLRSSANELQDPRWIERFNRLARQMHMDRNIHLLTSTLTSVPITFGWLKPVILLPVGLINHLDPEEVEAILIHELAHIQRQDFIWNTWQQSLECLFYYHPLTWWLSRQITDEREHLCDEITLQHPTNALTYARALLHVQEWHVLPRQAALAATGRKDALLHRIQRIIDHSVKPDTMQRKWLIPLLLTLPVIAMTLMAWMPSAEGSSDPLTMEDHITLMDTLPQKNIMRKEVRNDIRKIVEDNDGQREEATFENGKLTELSINGEAIAPADYGQHADLIARMSERVSRLAPPPPPSPPGAPEAPEAPDAPDAPDALDEEVMEWTMEDGKREKKIIIRKGGDGHSTSKQIKTIIIEGDEDPMIWMENDEDGHAEKRIEIIREEEIIHGDDPHVLRFNHGGDDRIRKEIRIEKERADRERARAQEDRAILFRDGSGMNEQNMEIIIDGDAPEGARRFQFLGTRGGSIHERMTNQMLEEGLIQSRNEYKYDLNNKRLKIDGRRMPDAVHQRYLQLYRQYTGKTMTDKDRLRADIDQD